ncbi:hypothetical protein AB6F64_21895 [Providencia hangzhouensis]|uniref:hypothetical protein n=1 Tax=Providencia TaxID=586 RepID=UPI001E00C346|nr:hypothetical protein [Providencia rettgeri]ELR5267243.1 hypothetical protein [Providencia rettgeri]
MKKRDYHSIDPLIEPLVKTFNQCGFSTYASCQGHGWPVDYWKPYIAFISTTEHAGRLERRLREDMESPFPKLNWGWMINGGFNDTYQLCFSLRLCGHRRGYYRYWRPSINHDFAVIEKILITEFGSHSSME